MVIYFRAVIIKDSTELRISIPNVSSNANPNLFLIMPDLISSCDRKPATPEFMNVRVDPNLRDRCDTLLFA